MACILLFNLKDPDKITAIRLTAMRFGVPCREVEPEQQGQTIGSLLSGAENTAAPCRTPFTDEMLVMNELPSALFHTLLETLRNEGKTVRLKAVVTQQNKNWTAQRLHREISAEAAAMEKAAKNK